MAWDRARPSFKPIVWLHKHSEASKPWSKWKLLNFGKFLCMNGHDTYWKTHWSLKSLWKGFQLREIWNWDIGAQDTVFRRQDMSRNFNWSKSVDAFKSLSFFSVFQKIWKLFPILNIFQHSSIFRQRKMFRPKNLLLFWK